MPKRSNERPGRRLFVERDIQRLKEQLERFKPFLSRRKPGLTLDEFDRAAERLLGRIFGETSELVETYAYAKLGEAASLVNMPEEAQESGAHDVERESLHQRKQVLESAVAELETLRFGAAAKGRDGHGPLAGAKVSDYMSTDVRSVYKDASLKEAGRLLSKWKVGSLLVDDHRRYIGIITDTDLSRKGVGRGLDPNKTPVEACMSKPVISIEDSEPLASAIALMKAKGVRHLATTEDGTIIGVLSVSDLLRAYSDLAGLDEEGAKE
ncbi:MAG: CBS domain-containing protein [Nitrospirota bacterium]|nr:CBS domain-containing protein [Nitrospirota bacterium]MDE3244115.1 CBS domain-containing protein [Nitrospirota bacterium]